MKQEFVKGSYLLKDLEILRTLFHLTFGFLIFFSYYFLFSRRITLVIAGLIIILLIFFEIQKRIGNKLGRLYLKIGKPFFRHLETEKKFIGALTAGMGYFTAILFFPKNIALVAMLFLIIGDPIARFLRIIKHKRSMMGKLTIGTFGMFIACFLIAFTFGKFSLINSLITAFFVALVESFIDIRVTRHFNIDDNFFIPTLGGLILYLLSLY